MVKAAKQNKKSTEKSGPKLEPHQVIVKPALTEKAMYQATELNQYSFHVNPLASKVDIKNAIERLYAVKVAGVSTQTCLGKSRRYRFKTGRTKDWKKAIVTLDSESKIDFF
jgi:large subunit ribosomal protein L23